MEIRGLGLINVQDLFGVASTRSSKRVELVVQLERWEHGREYDRLGLDDEFYEVLGIADPDDPDAGGARPERRDPRRGRRAQPAAARPRPSCRAAARRAGSTEQLAGRAAADVDHGRGSLMREKRHAARRAARTAVTSRFVVLTGPVGFRQVAGDSRARGPRLLLRRQPAGHAPADARRADAARRHRDLPRRGRRRRPRREDARGVPAHLPAS